MPYKILISLNCLTYVDLGNSRKAVHWQTKGVSYFLARQSLTVLFVVLANVDHCGALEL